ncbi:MAG: DUF6596 domain-containing protein [Candidatus Sumerlaeia bacterium]|nr:DUF6596 domain-containing protein [Candidatus Sumerlaeia bacterium]
MAEDALRAAEASARDAYGRLLARLALRARDIDTAEDALSDAFADALRAWPRDGVPRNPEAWLLTAARRRLLDGARREGARRRLSEAAAALLAATEQPMPGDTPFADERLEMMFLCAHPALSQEVRAPLMLQVVLGFDAAAIGSVFLVPPSTMGQRLVRAKARIRDSGMRFERPSGSELAERLPFVLDAVYAAYGAAWEDAAPGGGGGLGGEALALAEVAAEHLPGEAEAKGLLALILYCESRRRARRSEGGEFVPVSEQDAALWDRGAHQRAEGLLRDAARLGRPGRYQTEAAIQSALMARAFGPPADSAMVAALHDALLRTEISAGAWVARAAARGAAFGPGAGLAALEAGGPAGLADYQPYWAVRADLLARAGRREEAERAYERAAGLATDPAVRRFLRRRGGIG